MVTEPMHVCQDQACSRLPRSTLAGPGTIASASKSEVLVNKNIVTSKTVAEKPCFDSISTHVFQLSTLNIIISYSVLCLVSNQNAYDVVPTCSYFGGSTRRPWTTESTHVVRWANMCDAEARMPPMMTAHPRINQDSVAKKVGESFTLTKCLAVSRSPRAAWGWQSLASG